MRLGYAYFDGLVQDCKISSALAMELLQSCTKPSISSAKITIDFSNKNDKP